MKPVVEIIEEAVKPLGVAFMYGHPLEIINILSKKKYDKFPVIMLFMDFDEEVSGNSREVTLHFVIANKTKPTYKAKDRYENNFVPVLYPLYKGLLNALKNSKYIENKVFEHTKTDRVYWGTSGLYGNTGNVFNDFVDAIEVTNLNLILNSKC